MNRLLPALKSHMNRLLLALRWLLLLDRGPLTIGIFSVPQSGKTTYLTLLYRHKATCKDPAWGIVDLESETTTYLADQWQQIASGRGPQQTQSAPKDLHLLFWRRRSWAAWLPSAWSRLTRFNRLLCRRSPVVIPDVAGEQCERLIAHGLPPRAGADDREFLRRFDRCAAYLLLVPLDFLDELRATPTAREQRKSLLETFLNGFRNRLMHGGATEEEHRPRTNLFGQLAPPIYVALSKADTLREADERALVERALDEVNGLRNLERISADLTIEPLSCYTTASRTGDWGSSPQGLATQGLDEPIDWLLERVAAGERARARRAAAVVLALLLLLAALVMAVLLRRDRDRYERAAALPASSPEQIAAKVTRLGEYEASGASRFLAEARALREALERDPRYAGWAAWQACLAQLEADSATRNDASAAEVQLRGVLATLPPGPYADEARELLARYAKGRRTVVDPGTRLRWEAPNGFWEPASRPAPWLAAFVRRAGGCAGVVVVGRGQDPARELLRRALELAPGAAGSLPLGPGTLQVRGVELAGRAEVREVGDHVLLAFAYAASPDEVVALLAGPTFEAGTVELRVPAAELNPALFGSRPPPRTYVRVAIHRADGTLDVVGITDDAVGLRPRWARAFTLCCRLGDRVTLELWGRRQGSLDADSALEVVTHDALLQALAGGGVVSNYYATRLEVAASPPLPAPLE